MARLNSSRAGRTAAMIASAALALAAITTLADCSQSLGLRDEIVAEVEASVPGPHLRLFDGSTQIARNGTVSWPDTLYGKSAVKALKIKNSGTEALVLSPSPVVISGAPSDTWRINRQPASLTLSPGDEIDFSLQFVPQGADLDFRARFMINSNDVNSPSFGFSVVGHSTEWRGKLTYPSSSGPVEDAHVAFEGMTLLYSCKQPTNSGSKISLWQSTTGGYSTTGTQNISALTDYAYNSRMAVHAGALHEFFSSVTGVNYYSTPNSSDSSSWQTLFYRAKAADASTTFFDGDLLIAGSAYLVWYDSAFGCLQGVRSPDPIVAFHSTEPHNVYASDGSRGGRYPSMKKDDAGALYILCASENLGSVTLSVPDGSFTSATLHAVSDLGSGHTVTNCALAVTGSGPSAVLHALWTDEAYDIWYSKTVASDLDGWSAPVSFAGAGENNACGHYALPFAVDGSGILIFLHVGSDTTKGLRISRSTDGGATWKHASLDADDWKPGYVSWTSLAAQGSTVCVAYTKQTSGDAYQFIFAKSLDGGATW